MFKYLNQIINYLIIWFKKKQTELKKSYIVNCKILNK